MGDFRKTENTKIIFSHWWLHKAHATAKWFLYVAYDFAASHAEDCVCETVHWSDIISYFTTATVRLHNNMQVATDCHWLLIDIYAACMYVSACILDIYVWSCFICVWLNVISDLSGGRAPIRLPGEPFLSPMILSNEKQTWPGFHCRVTALSDFLLNPTACLETSGGGWGGWKMNC